MASEIRRLNNSPWRQHFRMSSGVLDKANQTHHHTLWFADEGMVTKASRSVYTLKGLDATIHRLENNNMATTYGSDPKGLICGYLFDAASPGRPISLDDALQWLATEQAERSGAFIWLHFNLTDAMAEPWMQENLPLAPEYFEAMHAGSRSTRIEDAADHLIAVINDVSYEFSFEPSEIASLFMTVNERIAVSARSHPLRSIDRLREAVKDGCRFGSSMALLNHLMNDQGDVLVRIVRDATLQVDGIEDSLLLGRLQHKRGDLGKLRRVLVRL